VDAGEHDAQGRRGHDLRSGDGFPSMSVVEPAKVMNQEKGRCLWSRVAGRGHGDRDLIARVVAAGQDPSGRWVSDKDVMTM